MSNYKLRMENVAAFIVQMYRDENLIRAFDFDLELIGKHVINHLPVSKTEKLNQVNRYEDLIKKMFAEDLVKEGHKEISLIVDELTGIHDELKNSHEAYKKVYLAASPYINENIKFSERKIENEIQICLNGVFGFLLLKLEGNALNDHNQEMVEKFGKLLSFLSLIYKEKVESI